MIYVLNYYNMNKYILSLLVAIFFVLGGGSMFFAFAQNDDVPPIPSPPVMMSVVPLFKEKS